MVNKMNYTDYDKIITTNDPLLDFLIQLSATIIGAFVGFWLAMWWDRKKKKGDIRETKYQALDSIINELKDNQSGLIKSGADMKWDQPRQRFVGEYVITLRSAFDASINSGNFTLLPPDLQVEISDLYLYMDYYNSVIIQTRNYYTTSTYLSTVVDQVATELTRNVSSVTPKILDDIAKILPKLESAKES